MSFQAVFVLSAASLPTALTANAVHAAPSALSHAIASAVAAQGAVTLTLVQTTLNAMLYAKLQTAAVIVGACLAAAAGALLAQQIARPKAANPTPWTIPTATASWPPWK